jgi:integrase
MTARRGPKHANGEGTVYRDRARERPGGPRVWRIAVTAPDGRRRTGRHTGTKREAFEVRDRLRREVEATGTGTRPPRGGRHAWTVGTWLSYWQAENAGRSGLHGDGLSKSSVRREAWAAGEITKALGSRSLRTLAAEDVWSFLADRAAGIGTERRPWSQASCRTVRNLLARALDDAIERGHAPAPNKARVVKHMPDHAAKAEARFSLTAAEAQRLYHAARRDGDPAALVIALQLSTGMRPGEVMGLTWGRVEMGDVQTLRIDRAKTPTGKRTLHLSAPALAVLRDALRAAELRARDPEAYVFPAVKAPHVHERALIEALEDLAAGEEITVDPDNPRPPHPHELRHTFASLLLDQDVSPQKVADILGDKVETVLRVYAHKIKAVAGEAEAVHVAALYGEAS